MPSLPLWGMLLSGIHNAQRSRFPACPFFGAKNMPRKRGRLGRTRSEHRKQKVSGAKEFQNIALKLPILFNTFLCFFDIHRQENRRNKGRSKISPKTPGDIFEGSHCGVHKNGG